MNVQRISAFVTYFDELMNSHRSNYPQADATDND